MAQDFTNAIRQLRAKLARQEQAAKDTRALIEALEATNRTK